MESTLYTISGLPRSFFRDPYLVVTIWQPTPIIWRAEYRILTKRPHEHLMGSEVTWDIANRPSELPAIDEAFMLSEARLRADAALSKELERLMAQNPTIELEPISFRPSQLALSHLWSQGVYRAKIADIAKETESPKFAFALQMLMGQQPLKPVQG